MESSERRRFDHILERVLHELPGGIRALLEEAPLIVEDHPSLELRTQLGLGDDDLCGLHSGQSLTERSVMDPPDMPETIHLFREGIVNQAGGWCPLLTPTRGFEGGPAAIAEEVRITLLHEIGHHFGLEEDDLRKLGYS